MTTTTNSIALLGMTGAVVEVEADVDDSIVAAAVLVIGLPDHALGEVKDRVRAALATTDHTLPQCKVTFNLAPAALPKHGRQFDLAIAMAYLIEAKAVSGDVFKGVVFFAELGLDGTLHHTAGVLPAAIAAKRAGFDKIVVAEEDMAEAQLSGIAVFGAKHIRDLTDKPLNHTALPAGYPPPDVLGEYEYAMIAAAAGGHNVFMLGNTSIIGELAKYTAQILPRLTDEQALELTSIQSLSGLRVDHLQFAAPFEQVHHTASAAAVVGGGSGIIRPGAASRATHGVLYLPEAPEFAAAVLDALRMPLESGVVSIHRANAVAHYPAAFQLVMSSNPCPCGQYGMKGGQCTCTPFNRRRYLARISGPLLDRVDIQMRVNNPGQRGILLLPEVGAEKVRVARARAAARLADTPWSINAHVPGSWLRGPKARLSPHTTNIVDRALERGGVTMRGYDRILRLGWTLADLEGTELPLVDHLEQAMRLRKALSS